MYTGLKDPLDIRDMRNGRRLGPVLLLLLSICAFSANLVHGAGSSASLSQLQTLKRSSHSQVLSLSIGEFEKYVERAPREYTLIVMFTADASMCKPCAPMLLAIEKIAKEYEELPDRKKSRMPVFFASLKVSPNDQAFLAKYSMQHVPILYAFRAGNTRNFPSPLNDNSPDNYQIQQFGILPNQMKNFVNARTSSSLSVVRSGQIPFVPYVRAVMPIILVFVGFAVFVGVASGAYKRPMVWFGLVMLVYIFSVGGGFFSWIHNQPLAVVDSNGITQYFAEGSRSQYVGEGFFVSVTCVSISVLVILIQELPWVLPYKSGQSAIGLSMIMMTFVAIVALLSLYQIVSLSKTLAHVKEFQLLRSFPLKIRP